MTGPRPTIAVKLDLPPVFVERIQEGVGPGEVVVASDDARAGDAEILAAYTNDLDGLRRSVTPAVRWVHALSTGIDGFPLDVVGDRLFTCSRGASAVPIAEWVLAMVLAHAKRLPESWVHEPPEQWNTARLDGLEQQTLGLVGIGSIGSEVASRARAFGMEVLAFRRRSGAAAVAGVEVVTSLHDLLGRSDHVVVAAPATPATFHLLDRDALAAMKPGAHLVNVARGSLVDQDALLAALDAGAIAAASLDTVDPEPLPAGHRLYAHPRVRLSPHIAWVAPGSLRRTFELFVDNVRRYRAGEPLHGVVDLAAGY